MRLDSIELTSFRAFGNATLELAPHGVTLIVGANNSGKSSLLSAIDVLLGLNPPLPIENTAAGAPARIVAVFTPSDEERQQVLGGNSRPEWRHADLLRQTRVILESMPADREFNVVAIEVSLSKATFAAVGTLTAAGPNHEIRSVDLPNWVANHGPADPFELTSRVSGGGLGRHLLNGNVAGIDLVIAPIRRWTQGVYHFRSLRPGTGRSAPSSGNDRLAPTGENLPQVLLALASAESPEWQAIRDAMADLVPDAGVLRTPVRGSEVEIVFEDSSGVRRNLLDLGTGVQQLLMATVVGITHEPGGLVMVEEPETNLHPAAQRALLRRMGDWSASRQILATTHSTVFLDRRGGSTGIWLVERSGPTSTLRRIEPDQTILEGLGVRLSDVLAAERLLLVEGDTDLRILDLWFRDEMRHGDIETVAIRGSDAARGTERLALVANVGQELHRQVLFLRDRDEMPLSEVERLERHGRVKVLPVREIENFFLFQPAAIVAGLAARISEAPSPGELDQQLERMAQEFIEIVVLRRVVSRLAPIYPAPWGRVPSSISAQPSLAQLLTVIDGSLGAAQKVPAEAASTWEEEEQDVRARWNDDWRSMVPAAELLSSVWLSHDVAFDKSRDGYTIASAMTPPPAIAEILADFIASDPDR